METPTTAEKEVHGQTAQQRHNASLVIKTGNLLEALFEEISDLPLTDGAKTALISVMMGEVIKVREGNATISARCVS